MGCWLLLLALFFSLSYRKKYSFCTVCVCKIRETINEQYHKLLMLNYLCHDNTQNVQYTQSIDVWKAKASDIWPLATGFHSYDVGSRTPSSTVHLHLHNRFRLAVHTRSAESVRCVWELANTSLFLSIFKHSRKRCGTTIFGICNFSDVCTSKWIDFRLWHYFYPPDAFRTTVKYKPVISSSDGTSL